MRWGPDVSRVHIEFQRVQTWLFAVPRLRAMLGANTLLGEALRVELPALAGEQGRGWQSVPLSGVFPGADEGDPVAEHDNPATDAQAGILSRDGGYFEADFGDEAQAECFADAAASLLRRAVPGLRYRIHVDGKEREHAERTLSRELPVLARG